MKQLTPSESKHITTLLDELTALVECDDGTCFPWQVCEQIEIAREIMGLEPCISKEEDE